MQSNVLTGCEPCENGYWCKNGTKNTACPIPGTGINLQQTGCETCENGLYSPSGSSLCKVCEKGHYCRNGLKFECGDDSGTDVVCHGASCYCAFRSQDAPSLVSSGYYTSPINASIMRRSGQVVCP